MITTAGDILLSSVQVSLNFSIRPYPEGLSNHTTLAILTILGLFRQKHNCSRADFSVIAILKCRKPVWIHAPMRISSLQDSKTRPPYNSIRNNSSEKMLSSSLQWQKIVDWYGTQQYSPTRIKISSSQPNQQMLQIPQEVLSACRFCKSALLDNSTRI